MPPQGRLGDRSLAPADAHGCPGCPHPAIGAAVSGSPTVNVNGRPALRVGDTGVHAACCGPNVWSAATGAPHVFVNGKAAHRVGDADRHCGGAGRMIEGSPTVFVGDQGGVGGRSVKSPEGPVFDRAFALLDLETRRPLAYVPYKIVRADGSEVLGVTDEDGRTTRIGADWSETIRLLVPHGDPDEQD